MKNKRETPEFCLCDVKDIAGRRQTWRRAFLKPLALPASRTGRSEHLLSLPPVVGMLLQQPELRPLHSRCLSWPRTWSLHAERPGYSLETSPPHAAPLSPGCGLILLTPCAVVEGDLRARMLVSSLGFFSPAQEDGGPERPLALRWDVWGWPAGRRHWKTHAKQRSCFCADD